MERNRKSRKLTERVEKIEKFTERVEMENLNERVQKLECMIQYQKEDMEKVHIDDDDNEIAYFSMR